MWYFVRSMVIAVGLAAAPSLAFAQNCDAVVDDQAHVISDPGRVTTAANNLGNQGAMVRVRTFDSAGAGGLDKTIEQLRRDCPAWQGSDDKHWKSTMLVLAYTPDKHQVGAYYGSSLVARLGKGKWDEMIKDRLVPQIQASAKGDKTAITTGMVATLNEMQGALARPSIGGATTINQAADYGGLWKVLGWIVGFGILFVLVAGGLWLMFRTKSDSAATDGAKAQARRARSRAISGINEITDEATLASAAAMIMAAPAEKQSTLNLKHARVKSLGNQALQTLSTFDDASGANPNEGLSVAAYQSNQRRYEEIIASYVVPAQQLLAEINAGDVGPKAAEPAPPPAEPYRPPVAPTQPFVPGQPQPSEQRPHFLPDDASREAERQRERDGYAGRGSAPRNYPPEGRVWPRSEDSPWQRPAPPPPPPPQPQVVERVVERDSGNDVLTGIVVGGLLSGSGRDRDRDEDRREREAARREREEARQEREEEAARRREEAREQQRERQAEPDYSSPARREPEPEPEDSGGSFSVAVEKEEDSGGSFSTDTSDGGGSFSVDTSSPSSDNNA